MSDFFTKKQKKFWCEKCRIFVEYTKQIIEQHNKSKNHLKNMNADTAYRNMKKKFEKMHGSGVDYNTYTQEMNSGYGTELLNKKTGRDNTDFSNNMNLSSGGNFMLEEIKKEKLKEMAKEKFNVYIKSKQEKIWGEFFDETNQLPYYYNYITGVSQWEKPEDFDGESIYTSELTNKPEKESEEKKEKEKKGVVGKWEVVNKGESVFGTRKNNNRKEGPKEDEEEVLMPGVISKTKYQKLENFESENSYEDSFEDLEDKSKEEREMPMDKYVVSSKNKTNIHKEIDNSFLTNEDLVNISKKLKSEDYDLKFQTMKKVPQQEEQMSEIKIQKNDHIQEENKYPEEESAGGTIEPISFSFKNVKKNVKKINSKIN
jgi:hypothetical protein